MNKIYVVCPYGLITGGPDALHQMVYYLRQNNYDAVIVYCDIKSHRYQVPEPYQLYLQDYLLLSEIEDSITNVLIVPETQTQILDQYSHLKKCIWWLSVDNYQASVGIANKFKRIIKKLRWRNLKKFYKIHALIDVLKHRRYDFGRGDVTHLCASYYAADYVKQQVNDVDKIFLCIEPISKFFLSNSKFSTNNKQDYILYNPKKNYQFTKKIIKLLPNCRFIPLQGFSQSELLSWYSQAKLYIDFGPFPGAERIPKEAVINGCCILTGRSGAAAFNEDVPIPAEYKIAAEDKNLPIIVEKIQTTLRGYHERVEQFATYRETVWQLETQFTQQLKIIMNILFDGEKA